MADRIEDGLRVMAEYVTLPYEGRRLVEGAGTIAVQVRDERNREMMQRILAAGVQKDRLGEFVTMLGQLAGRQLDPGRVKWWIEVRLFPLMDACVRLVAVPDGLTVETAHDFEMDAIVHRWNRAEALLVIADGVGEVRSKL